MLDIIFCIVIVVAHVLLTIVNEEHWIGKQDRKRDFLTFYFPFYLAWVLVSMIYGGITGNNLSWFPVVALVSQFILHWIVDKLADKPFRDGDGIKFISIFATGQVLMLMQLVITFLLLK